MDSMKRSKVCAVIVTFNKLELLKVSLEAVRNQTYELSNILVVNNNSTDGTKEYLEDQKDLNVINMKKNLGGAGGFQKGIQEFMQKTDCEFCWIMDDDTIPDKDALEKLIDAGNTLNNEFGFLSSFVYWMDGTPCRMNKPTLSNDWNVEINNNLLKIDKASFVSILVKRKYIEIVGLPIGEFFIWGDDTEFTSRISKEKCSFFVQQSKVLHKMKKNTAVDILVEKGDRLGRYKFEFRNRFFVAKKQGFKKVCYEVLRNIHLIVKILYVSEDAKLQRIKQIIIGSFKGVLFNPKIKQWNEK
jgi:GT2 family glycosyltransferase